MSWEYTQLEKEIAEYIKRNGIKIVDKYIRHEARKEKFCNKNSSEVINMDYHDKAISSMLNNLGLFTSDSGKGTSMNLSKYENIFNDAKRSKVGLLETLKDSSGVHSESDRFRMFRKNHFEVFITDPAESKVYDDLRLCTHSIDVNLYSGKIVLKVYATKSTLETISNLRPHQKLNLKYMMYNPDASLKFVAYDDVATLNDVAFSSCSYVDQSKEIVGEIVTLTFKSKDAAM